MEEDLVSVERAWLFWCGVVQPWVGARQAPQGPAHHAAPIEQWVGEEIWITVESKGGCLLRAERGQPGPSGDSRGQGE